MDIIWVYIDFLPERRQGYKLGVQFETSQKQKTEILMGIRTYLLG